VAHHVTDTGVQSFALFKCCSFMCLWEGGNSMLLEGGSMLTKCLWYACGWPRRGGILFASLDLLRDVAFIR
jgi:hypothetical protein